MVRPKRGEVYWAHLDPALGREQKGLRPALVVSDTRLSQSGLVFQMPLTTGAQGLGPPLAVDIGLFEGKPAKVLVLQARSISVTRLAGRIGELDVETVERCLDALLQCCGRKPARKVAQNDG